MLVVYLLFSLFYYNAKCEIKFPLEDKSESQDLTTCIIDIVGKYYSERKVFTYINTYAEDEDLIKAIHSKLNTSILLKQSVGPSGVQNTGYIITAETVPKFTENFKNLHKDPAWNPSGRFLIIIRSLKEHELKRIFDALLKRHVINAVVMNGTKEPYLFTYNPYDNYACGKYYNEVIRYGLCSQATNIFPNKLVTGLRNCTLLATVPHRPPYSIHPLYNPMEDQIKIGVEQYVFQILGEKEQFKVNFSFDYDNAVYTTINSDMEVVGPMAKLQNNETDVMFGSILLVSTRMKAFTCLHGYLDYTDDLRFLVKRASYVATWKNIYLVFQPLVWGLLLVTFLLCSFVLIRLLHADDKFGLMLKLLKNLLSHGCSIPDRTYVKFVFILWVWFAYLVNSFYQSSLVSLTGNPIKEYQIRDETELIKYNYKPCISPGLLVFMYTETNQSAPIKDDCLDPFVNIRVVANSDDLYTLVQSALYNYNKKTFYDEYGHSPVYYFDKPYSKFIFAMFFYKGFPLTEIMRKNAIRLRENGLIQKKLNDDYHTKKIKFHFHEKGFEARFVIPWSIYVAGCIMATMVFVYELLSNYYGNK